ncbi:hypothetical protein [uncultured Nitratireductor sp.]|uniref:hypothetical protein n=1 Tax=uncultured Nitratireductor sp. TaxID=520953 RepID=UPI0025FDEFD2|nr:hypothetical protein [uncultured Nitratireductor sp.]
MRSPALMLCLLPTLCLTAPAAAKPLAETLVGSWTCSVEEGASDIAMTLNYRRSDAFLVGEIIEDNGAALLDVWLDDGATPLGLRRILSYDATIEMKLMEEAAERMKLEGEMRHILGSTGKVRETFRFTGRDAFRATWETDNGEGWQLIMERSCTRV